MAGALVVTPYYSRPSQAGLAAHFRAVADGHHASRPALRHPGAHRAAGSPTTPWCGLARDVPNIVGVKDATGDPAGSARLMAEAPDGLRALQRGRRPDPGLAGAWVRSAR